MYVTRNLHHVLIALVLLLAPGISLIKGQPSSLTSLPEGDILSGVHSVNLQMMNLDSSTLRTETNIDKLTTNDITLQMQSVDLGSAQLAKTNAGGMENTFVIASGGPSWDWANSISQTADGGYVVAGCTQSFGAGETDIMLIKYHTDGTISWAKAVGGMGYDGANYVSRTIDGGFVLAGYTDSFGAGGDDVIILKYSAAGYLEWARTSGGADDEVATSVIQTSTGDFVIAGKTDSFGEGSDDIFLMKYSVNGTLTWTTVVGGSNYDYARSLVEVPAGGYIVAGATHSYGAGNADIFLLKFNTNGNLVWAKTAGGSGYDFAFSIANPIGILFSRWL